MSSNTVLISIRPEYAERIFKGEKRYEFRKQKFRRPIKKVLMYSTKPVGEIAGFFTCSKILNGSPLRIWKLCSKFAGVSEEEFFDYFNGRDVAYALKIERVKKFTTPIELNNVIGHIKPPRSFMYVEDYCGTNIG